MTNDPSGMLGRIGRHVAAFDPAALVLRFISFMKSPEQLPLPAASPEPRKWSLYQNPKEPDPVAPPADASERELRLNAALTRAKEQLRELRARLVRADAVAYIWTTVPASPPEAECGRLMRRIFAADDDMSLRTAVAQWERQRDLQLQPNEYHAIVFTNSDEDVDNVTIADCPHLAINGDFTRRSPTGNL